RKVWLQRVAGQVDPVRVQPGEARVVDHGRTPGVASSDGGAAGDVWGIRSPSRKRRQRNRRKLSGSSSGRGPAPICSASRSPITGGGVEPWPPPPQPAKRP